MIHRDHDPLAVALRRFQHALHAVDVHGQWPLAQHVDPRRQRRHCVNFVEVVGGAHDDDIRTSVLQYLLDVVVRLPHVEAGGEGLRLGEVVVADRRDFDPGDLPQDGEVRHLGDAPRPHHGDADGITHR